MESVSIHELFTLIARKPSFTPLSAHVGSRIKHTLPTPVKYLVGGLIEAPLHDQLAVNPRRIWLRYVFGLRLSRPPLSETVADSKPDPQM